ncbi:hypothetical protein LWI28_016353 [Acer negundo]|uniref:Chlororespiratory reduction 4 n=1 Tax=Acer negundo TaxID=4023 RepID=A0AAD5ITK0_ACENE|nr:hypothetical protein LWI28_008198 [Acer negundo]KAI9177531.1 hypothetical protein LWI28_016353 [Acer negundo]
MKTLSAFKLNLKNPLLFFLQFSKTTQQILQIHAQLITTNLITDPFILSQLLLSLTSPNAPDLNYAELLFNSIHQPNSFMHNTMIKCYTQNSNPGKALNFYVNMRSESHLLDNYTYPFVLKACGVLMGLVEGREIHGDVVKRGFWSDVFVVNGLIGMYSKCGDMASARFVFDGSEVKDLVSWNMMLGLCVQSGDIRTAQKMFDEMPDKNVISWSIMIDGYGKKVGDVTTARLLFDCMPIKDMVSWSSMIDAYAKIGKVVAARQLFDEMPEKNVITWSIMIDGYAQHGKPKESLNLFRQMLCQGVRPDMVSVMGAISACSQLGALDQGRWIHMYMKRTRITMDILVQTALMDMYMKCGSLDEGRRIFYSMPKKTVVSYNVMIVGLGINGFGEEALECFAQMEREGIPKDDLIFLGVLTACSHAGLVTEGFHIFERMKKDYRVEPKVEHYNCLVDLLARAGQLEQALNVIDSMPMRPNSALWGTLLMACRTHRNVALAEFVVERLVELKADNSGVYVLLSNIYADVGMWNDALRIRKLIKDRKMKKETGSSVIEVDGNIKEFVSGEINQVWSQQLESIVQSFLRMSIS